MAKTAPLTSGLFVIDGPRPFVRILSEKVRSRCCRPPENVLRLVPLSDPAYVRQMEVWLASERLKRREPLWPVTDETLRNWLKAALKRAKNDRVNFSVPVTPHTFRYSYVMHLLYHHQPGKVIQVLAGHKEARAFEVYKGCLCWTRRSKK